MNQTIFTIDAYLALFVVLINLIFGILILVRTSRTTLYLVFFFICLSNMLWNFGDAIFYFSGNRFWFYLSLIGSGMLPALMFHFINTLVKPERKSTVWVMVAYSFSGFLAFSSPLALFHLKTKDFVDSTLWNILYLILLGPFIFAGLMMLIRTLNRIRSEEEKSRLRCWSSYRINGPCSTVQDPSSSTWTSGLSGLFFYFNHWCIQTPQDI